MKPRLIGTWIETLVLTELDERAQWDVVKCVQRCQLTFNLAFHYLRSIVISVYQRIGFPLTVVAPCLAAGCHCCHFESSSLLKLSAQLLTFIVARLSMDLRAALLRSFDEPTWRIRIQNSVCTVNFLRPAQLSSRVSGLSGNNVQFFKCLS